MKKNYLLAMLALLFLFSCTREYLMESSDTIQVHPNSRVNKVTFGEMESFIQKNAKNALPDYLKPNNLNKNTQQYITAIDTADIIKVVHNDIASFTLKVNTLGDKDFTFSNLVINVHNGKIEEYIYHYKPDAQWLRAYLAGEKSDYKGILKITAVDGNDTSSNDAKKNYSILSRTPTTCMVYLHVPCYGSGCPCSDYNGVTYYIMATCTTGGGGSSGGNPGGPTSGGSPGGGGGTVPNVPTTEQINNFIAFLSPSIHAYISQNPDSLTDISNYFAQNGLAPKHQSFITSVLEYVESKGIAWSSFSSIFASASAYKNQYPDEWEEIRTVQDFAFDFMLQNPNISWAQFQNWFIEGNLSSNLMTEFIYDLNNPDIVKPTKRFKNHAKINGIYNQVKTAANFNQYLKNFEPTFSVAHLMFDIGNVVNSAALAQTEQPQNYWIKITFNQNWNYSNTPKIIIANTFMHEIIHAEMFRKLLTIAPNDGDFDMNLVLQYLNNNNYSGIFDYYIRFSTNNTDVDHEIMGAHYINIMVNFLKQVYGNKYTNTEYKAVAWLGGGLKGTRAWNLLPQSEKELLENTYQDNYYSWEL